MKENVSLRIMIIVGFLLIFAACKKDIMSHQPLPKPPVVHAGKDTVIYLPFSSYDMKGSVKGEMDSWIVSYTWRQLTGPPVDIVMFTNFSSRAVDIKMVGDYEFEVTATDGRGLSSRDTVKVTVAVPNCSSRKGETIIISLPWNYEWTMELNIYDFLSYLPSETYLTNIYIKRDASGVWETVAPYYWSSSNPNPSYQWEYGNGILAVYAGKNNTEDDTPDVKIEYCY